MSSQTPSNTGTNWSMGAGLGAAVAASACCTIPLALVSVGVGGAWIGGLTALAPYRWVFVALAVAALGYAGYNEWQLSLRPDCDCETMFSSATRRMLLGGATLLVVGLVVSPYLLGTSPDGATQRAQAAVTGSQDEVDGSATPASFQHVVLTVDGMTCAACPKTVRTSLEGIEGVYKVEATYEPPEAVVRFDPDKVSVKELTTATENAGYPSHPKQPS